MRLSGALHESCPDGRPQSLAGQEYHYPMPFENFYRRLRSFRLRSLLPG
jgi:hypothetical protein